MTFQQHPAVEAAPLLEELMLFHPQLNTFCVLNRTASFLWTYLAEPCTAERLAEEICQGFEGITLTDALRDVRETLQLMSSLNLVMVASSSLTQEA